MENRPRIILPDRDANPGAGMFEALLDHFGAREASREEDPQVVTELRRELEREFFGRDMQALWEMLAKTTARAGGLPRGDGQRVRLLNLACGRCEEAAVLSAFFDRADSPVHQFAMDLREREIDSARRRYAATERLFARLAEPSVRSRENRIEFVADDAIRLAGYDQVPAAFDVVFIRHQNLWHDATIWRRIYQFALERIDHRAGGYLVITSYFDQEHLQALAVLREVGGQVVVSEQNPATRHLDHPGKSVDRHVAVIRRGPQKRKRIDLPTA